MTIPFQGSLQTQNNLAEIAANGTQMVALSNLGAPAISSIETALNGAASGYIIPVLNGASANSAPLGWSEYNTTTENTPFLDTYGLIYSVGTLGTNVPATGGHTWIYQTAYPTAYPFFPFIRTNINDTGWTPWQSVAGNQNGATFISSAVTLTSSYLGQLIECTGTGYTVTVPSPSASQGMSLKFWFNTTGTITLYTPYGNFDGPSGSGLPTFTVSSGNGLVMTITSDGYNWFMPNFGLGENNAEYYDVTSERAMGTTYTNTYGKPIFVTIQAQVDVSDGTLYFWVNGATVGYSMGAFAANAYLYIVGIVPAGLTYELTATPGYTWTLNNWYELQ